MQKQQPDDVCRDDLAMQLAHIMAAANKQARELGVEASHSAISITQQPAEDRFVWRVSYGPQDYVGQRGGDLIIDIDPVNVSVHQVLRGQ